jgi:hypothetical protein
MERVPKMASKINHFIFKALISEKVKESEN